MTSTSKTAPEALIQWWDETHSEIAVLPASSADIIQVEVRLCVRFPSMFREYLLLACPAADVGWDKEMVTWWSLGELKSAFGDGIAVSGDIVADKHKLILFADFSFWCWAWAINCSDGPNYGEIVGLTNGGKDRVVAADFSEFINTYVTNPDSLHP